jgi:hypothetical protein
VERIFRDLWDDETQREVVIDCLKADWRLGWEDLRNTDLPQDERRSLALIRSPHHFLKDLNDDDEDQPDQLLREDTWYP